METMKNVDTSAEKDPLESMDRERLLMFARLYRTIADKRLAIMERLEREAVR